MIFIDKDGNELNYGYASFALTSNNCLWCGREGFLNIVYGQTGFCCWECFYKWKEKQKNKGEIKDA